MYRQGDILIVPIKSPVKGGDVPHENGRVVLAHGEVTGHHHSFRADGRVRLYREDGAGGGLFMSVTGGVAQLEHQEHATIQVPEGKYRVVRQREYSPDAIRNVSD